MGRSVRAFVAVALALGGVLVGVFGAPLNAGAAPRRRPPAPAPVPTWTVDRVRIESVGGEATSVVGVGTYPGALDVVPATAGAARGLAVVNEVGFEEYVAGISEVPSAWPMEALKAQAIAARTYALWEMGRTTASEYRAVGAQTCASQACQVYTGVAKGSAPMGDRWVAAVEATRGEVLWWRDGPIVAKYSSSNGGQSVPGGQPYLRAVDDPDDAHSPLHRWRVTVTAHALAAGLGLPGRRIVRVDRAGDAVAVTTVAQSPTPTGEPATGEPDGSTGGSGTQAASTSDGQASTSDTEGGDAPATADTGGGAPGTADDGNATASTGAQPSGSTGAQPSGTTGNEPVTTTVPIVEFRERVNAAIAAPAHVPRTLPTVRFGTALVDGGQAVLFDGRGWGHGIGLSQWGAFGKARRGMKAPDILATYYAGLKPVRPPEPRLPASIKVAVATGRAAVDVEPQAGSKARLRIVAGDGTVLAHAAAGRWTVRPAAGGGVQVTGPPTEHGAPLLAHAGTAPGKPKATDRIELRVRLGHDALVGVTATRPTGEQVAVGKPRRHGAGDLVLRLPAAGAVGAYAVTVHADRGGGRIATLDVPVTVTSGGGVGRADRSGRGKAAVDRGRRAAASGDTDGSEDNALTVSAAGAVGGGFPGVPETTAAVALVAGLGATRSGARALGRRWLRRLH